MSQSDFERKLQKYAEVAVKVGLNLQPGQKLLITSLKIGIGGTPIEVLPLIRAVTIEAYKAGARLVEVVWHDYEMELIRFQYAPRDSFSEFPESRMRTVAEYCERGDAILNISAGNPELYAGQDPELIKTIQDTRIQNLAPYSDFVMVGAMNWLIISASNKQWAAKVLPDVPEEEQEAVFWEKMFDICRVNADDPIAAWEKHLSGLEARSQYLNDHRYSALHLKAPGTDLRVGLPAGHKWLAARQDSRKGIVFTPNIPTEEVFTLPHRDHVDGVLSATMPLSYSGSLMDGFSMKFEGGRVVNMSAKVGENVLRNLLDTDEGASHLGEIALVPHSSPISQSGLLFYNTLFDENASSHVALGRAYRFSMYDGNDLTNDEFTARGGNSSLIHIDFMIGSGEMDIDGVCEDGSIEPVMRQGEWAFDA